MNNLPNFNKIFMDNFRARVRLHLEDAFNRSLVRVRYIERSAFMEISILYEGEVYKYIYPLDDDMLLDLMSCNSRRINDVLERLVCYCIEDYKNDVALEAIRERVKEC